MPSTILSLLDISEGFSAGKLDAKSFRFMLNIWRSQPKDSVNSIRKLPFKQNKLPVSVGVQL